MAFTIDVKAALVFVVVIPLLCIVVFGIMLVSIPLYRRVQERLDQVTATHQRESAGGSGDTGFFARRVRRKSVSSGNEALVKIRPSPEEFQR